jgi:hypothetical protein
MPKKKEYQTKQQLLLNVTHNCLTMHQQSTPLPPNHPCNHPSSLKTNSLQQLVGIQALGKKRTNQERRGFKHQGGPNLLIKQISFIKRLFASTLV